MKLLIVCLCGMLVFSAKTDASDAKNEKIDTAGKKAVVVYYSRTGSTKLVAEMIAGRLNAGLRRIEEVKKRKWLPTTLFFGGYEATSGKCSKLKPMDFSLEGYDLVFLGTPVWASKPTPAMNSFVAGADFTGKNVVLFFTMGGDKYKKAAEILKKKIEAKGGIVQGTFGIQTESTSGIKKAEEEKLLENAGKDLDGLLQ